jgi:outer membrane usher protein
LRTEFDGSWASDRDADARVGMIGSLVYADKSIHAARPVGSGFALVRVPDLPGVQVLHNRMHVGKTDFRGALLVPGLIPYNGSYISINPDDIPLDRELEREGQYVAVPYGGATTLRFAEKRLLIVRGRLVLPDGKPVPRGGEATVVGGAQGGSPVGSEGVFELIDLLPGRYQLEVQYTGGKCTADIQVKAQQSEIDLGAASCAPSSSSAPSP